MGVRVKIRIALLAFLVGALSVVASLPAVSYADLTMLVARYLGNTVTMIETVASTQGNIVTNTVDGADSGSICLSGGGACGSSRGGRIQVYGNEEVAQTGAIQIELGAGGGAFALRSNGSARWTVAAAGGVTQAASSGNVALTGQLTSSTTSDLGWSVQSAANQACNTTCTSGCVFGQETTSKAILACTDATADSCLCAGAS